MRDSRAWMRLAFPLIALVLLSGCERSGEGYRNCVTLPSNLIPPPPGTATETLAVSGVRLVLRTDLIRDFMPMSPPQGRPMYAIVRLVEVDTLAIPGGIVPDHLWALQPPRPLPVTGTWSTPLLDDPVVVPGQLWARAGCGPLWEPGTFATVIVRVPTPEGDRFLQQDSVAITRTD